ncbi:protein kinase domain-containing protein [Rossellomorea aquimaris]|uniref:Serine/threonine protein kinase n=1 Tax=Rossellomorea aquimaris TaxID=189382 RepID=A0A366ERD8_9BACI|nr:protein kinase [Rossellomorea aquimaris]RBP04496.1 serine/threonine protein kinase [Rossellomorea aquimaris]
MTYSDYRRIDQLGEGGNGWVYLMRDKSDEEFAVKVSKIEKVTGEFSKLKLERFKTEAIKVNELYRNGQKGIIPVYNYELPCEATGKYFFVMPKAVPLEEMVKSSENIYELTAIFKDLALTLSELHNKNISHRDIKPENILYYQGKYCFGDFGLIDYPEKEDLTRAKEALGNRKTMAPEMRIPLLVTDPKPADVYSFAKTLWVVLTGEEYAFDGQFNYFENNRLHIKYPEQHLVELYKLLRDSTAENPDKRPNIKEFLNRLLEWERISNDKGESSKSLWRFIEQNVLQQTKPSTVIWKERSQVVEILKQISITNFNHTFIHEGGGMDLIDIDFFDDIENGMVSINFGFNMVQVFKVKRLIWELPNNDPEFSYFRLEFDKIKPIFPQAVIELQDWMENQKYQSAERIVSEDLIVNSKGKYEPYREEEGVTFSSVTRRFDGSFLIVPKGSIYNSIQNTYDGRHSKFCSEEFREYMEILQYIYNHKILGDYFWNIANEDPFKEKFINELKRIRVMCDEEVRKELGIFIEE